MTTAVAKYVGEPTGPKRFIDELGCETPTFNDEPGGKMPALRYHVPLECRGDYRPKELANYDPSKDYRTDLVGKMLCQAKTQADNLCSSRAVNRSYRCNIHGGRLHPLDKLVKDKEDSAESQSLSRYRQFVAGQITVDDLDDEELATCGFRGKDGRIFKPRNVPREMAQGFQKAIYERATTELRSLTVKAAETMGEIMLNRNIEPDIRLKAALSVIERNLGKTPQIIAVTDAKAYEQVFDDILAVRSERLDDSPIPQGDNSIGAALETIDVEFDDGTASRQDVSDSGLAHQSDSGPERDESARDARLFERNDAILAQSIEVKDFEYDLSDHSVDIQKATRKRYATRALGDDSKPYNVLETPMPNGIVNIKYIAPSTPKAKAPNKTQTSKRKTFTLSDFG